jgi:uncharacterized protein DUF4395
VPPRSDPVDARADRAVQGALAVLTLGAFVFWLAWLIPILGLLVGVGAALGPERSPLHLLFTTAIGPRLPPATATVPADTVRIQDLLAFGLLAVATLCLLIGLGGFAWIFTLVEGLVAAVAATTGVHLGVWIRDQLRRR